MRTTLRIAKQLVDDMQDDLRRPHEFALERVGFLYCRLTTSAGESILLGYEYRPILDSQYIEDVSVGARFDSSSIREAMQFALQHDVCTLHVHLHEHAGTPRFSRTDTKEMQALMPCFVNVRPNRLHGALVLSADAAVARLWRIDGPAHGESVDTIAIVGCPMTVIRGANES